MKQVNEVKSRMDSNKEFVLGNGLSVKIGITLVHRTYPVTCFLHVLQI